MLQDHGLSLTESVLEVFKAERGHLQDTVDLADVLDIMGVAALDEIEIAEPGTVVQELVIVPLAVVAQLHRVELQERDAHPDLTLLAAGVEPVVDGLNHVFRHAATIVDDLDGEEVARRAVLHLDGDFGGTRPDGVVGDVDDVQVETFHVTESLVRPVGGHP